MKKLGTWVSVIALTVVTAGAAEAQKFGGQVLWADDAELGVGARVEIPFANKLSKTGPLSQTFFIGQFDWYLDPCGDAAGTGVDCQWWEINPGLAVPLNTTSDIKPYLGAGLNVAHSKVDMGTFGSASDTEMGLNLLGGIKFVLGSMDAFSEARISLGGGEQFAIQFGFLFGGSKK